MTVAATALAYPLSLPDRALDGLYKALHNRAIFRSIFPWVSGGFTPLILKEGLLLTMVAALLFTFSWLKIRKQFLEQESSVLLGFGKTWKAWIVRAEPWALALLCYWAISIAWSEPFEQALHTWVLAAAGLGVFLVVRSELSGPRLAVRFMLLCVACGLLVAVLALLQHLGMAPFLPASLDPRNRMSSLIGHNTGLSCWLMFPLSFALYFFITIPRFWSRSVAALCALLFLTVIIAAESRAVWVLALILLVLVPWAILRVHGKYLRLKSILASAGAIIAIIAGLSFAPGSNPLARLPVSLKERVTGHILNLDQLRRETRLRILVVSLSELFPANPIFGTGIGSFSWEYPKAQGQYFSHHPQSWLGTTTRRTDLAHNDYLQVLIETGLLGLGLLGGLVFALSHELSRTYRQLGNPSTQAIWWALTTPAAGVCLQACVDFPFHVAPIAVISIVSFALATTLNKSAHNGTIPLAQVIQPPGDLESESSRLRKATIVGLLGAIAIFFWLPWGWQALVGRTLVSDVYYNTGTGWLTRFETGTEIPTQRRIAMLDQANLNFRQAVVNDVFNGKAYEGQATALVNRASQALYTLQQERPEAHELPGTTSTALRMSIARDANAAIAIIDSQLKSGGLRYHYTWYLLGRARRMDWELEKLKTQVSRSNAYAEAVAALQKAVWYNPADQESQDELADLLAEGAEAAEAGTAVRNRLWQ